MAKRRPKNKLPPPDFHKQAVLFQWALGKLGVESLKQFRDRFQVGPDTPEGLDETTGLHTFFENIAKALPTVADGQVTPIDRLQEYEKNILEHTAKINDARQHHGQTRISWKYHQYLSLLFTEMYLDAYFDNPVDLRSQINSAIEQHNQRVRENLGLADFSDDAALRAHQVEPFATTPGPGDAADARQQLALLAFWCATGSGKTLLMHMHLLQFQRYHQRAFEARQWPKLDQIILVTPNDGLSRQHTVEMEQSGFDVVELGERGIDGLFADVARQSIKVLSIHKFQEDHGKTTVATEAFEGCNLVLVDEGHRGVGTGKESAWLSRRDQLSRGGFCIEYSATFKEAIGKDEAMRNRYARSILFDYAYRNFYRDGYGKDFSILNLEQDDKQEKYLTAALLLYYQQLKVWRDGGEAIKPFLIDKPLWVFVGHTVVGKASTAEDKVSVSDVVEVLLFFKRFLADTNHSRKVIEDLLTHGFVDHQNRNLLQYKLPHLDVSGDKPALAQQVHGQILRDVFNAPQGGKLAVQLIKGAAGELAVKVGENEPFGVVNVGDPDSVAQACAEHDIVRLEDDVSRPSLFQAINRDDSPINLLVGSRKFTEGWNSWRVSCIGLMRMGKGEGTQIIQLFGRGVRLRGYGMSLRRSSVLGSKPTPPKNLREVETLQVFGIKASYMNTFRDWIVSEVPEAMAKQTWVLPVVKRLPSRKLKTIKLQDEIDGQRVERGTAFRKLGPLVVLRPPHETAPEDAWLRANPTRLNWLPRIQGLAGSDRKISTAVGQVVDATPQKLGPLHVAMLDIDELLFGVESYKAGKGLARLHVDRQGLRDLLNQPGWYELLADPLDLQLHRYENRSKWQRIAQQLLNAYADRFYHFMRRRWEAPYIEVGEVDEDDPNLLGPDAQFTVETTDWVKNAKDLELVSGMVQELRELLLKNPLALRRWNATQLRTVPFAGHLYQPLLFVGANQMVRVSPVSLNKDEAQFVDDLTAWCESHRGSEVYLLRNQAGTGLGFFQAAHFYPDFLMWVHADGRQHLAFVDPKGLKYHGPSDPKIQFATRDMPRLQERVNAKGGELNLHAFILSNTPYGSLNWSSGAGQIMSRAEVEKLGILFQTDDPTSYIDAMMSQIMAACDSMTQSE